MTLKEKIGKLAGIVIKDYDSFFKRMDMAGRMNQKLIMQIELEILKYLDEQSLGEKPVKS